MSIRSEGVPEGQRPLMDGAVPGRDLNQLAGAQARQLSAGLGVGGVKFTCHQEVISRPALRCPAEFGDNADTPMPDLLPELTKCPK